MSKQKYIIAWRNTFSNETGYVGKVTVDHFENIETADKARRFSSEKAAKNTVEKLEAIGEGAQKNNVFTVESVMA